jgi:hypothetical protein
VLAYGEALEAAVLREATAGSFFSGAFALLARYVARRRSASSYSKLQIAIIGQPRLRDAVAVTAVKRSMVVPGESHSHSGFWFDGKGITSALRTTAFFQLGELSLGTSGISNSGS